MSAFGTAIGKVLRLVGISSPEDAAARPKAPAGAPSWRDARPDAPPDSQRDAQPAGKSTDKLSGKREDSGAD
jgi:hypothetical protein